MRFSSNRNAVFRVLQATMSGEVEGDDAFLAQNLRNVAARDFLRETFDDGRFAHNMLTGLAEEDRIVLSAPAEDLNDALDFILHVR